MALAGVMDSRSYVARDSCGFVAVLANERLGCHEFQSEAESHYVNNLRIRHTLEASACIRATEVRTLFSHTRPDGSDFMTVFPSGVPGYAVENVASAPSFQVALNSWLASPGHRANLMQPVTDFGYCERDGYFVALGLRRL